VTSSAPLQRRVVELSNIIAVAAEGARLLGDSEAIQPFVEDLATVLRVLRGHSLDIPKPRIPAPEPAQEAPVVTGTTAWDPDPPEAFQEASRSRALLLELIRRAAHDWVLYRTSRRMDQREVAQEAFTWLFEEREGHGDWETREREGRQITAFLNICELLDLDPSFVRNKVRQMTPHGIKMAGRPAENRYRRNVEVEHYIEHSVEIISLDELEKYH